MRETYLAFPQILYKRRPYAVDRNFGCCCFVASNDCKGTQKIVDDTPIIYP